MFKIFGGLHLLRDSSLQIKISDLELFDLSAAIILKNVKVFPHIQSGFSGAKEWETDVYILV